MAVMTALAWLRKLLEDDPAFEHEVALTEANETEFLVSNPPISAGEAVRVDGTPQTTPGQYSVGSINGVRAKIVFVAPLAAGKKVEIDYTRQTWGDDELNTYLAAAELEWDTGSVEAVYQAACYAVDTIGGVGAATALNFGSGEETYDMVSVWERLRRLREEWLSWLETRFDKPSLSIVEMSFDVDDPDSDFSNMGTYWVTAPPMPRMP